MISLIAAVDKNFGIGNHGDLPWPSITADMRYFSQTTKGHTVIMGRKTWESLPRQYRPLPDRRNIVITRDTTFEASNAEVVFSVDEALQKTANEEEVFIIGGSEIYRLFAEHADKLYLTFIDHKFEVDTYFPIKDLSEWKEIYFLKKEKGDDAPFPLSFKIFERI
jgi:dihydrofolate reductase